VAQQTRHKNGPNWRGTDRGAAESSRVTMKDEKKAVCSRKEGRFTPRERTETGAIVEKNRCAWGKLGKWRRMVGISRTGGKRYVSLAKKEAMPGKSQTDTIRE